ncbi:UDP-2,3-diacylglucosamine diphosphatase [Balneatrix alpica]|uniref:UDP-2,3-diacylglucosamine hydrolase n=1 Tax=Balneatrix alpica TaxID=75684 RepID=A0ABV5Z984_9GAMM|nr:UDP-2,3-diacylglucosamine diphosphatase [Balneatrix alpica]
MTTLFISDLHLDPKRPDIHQALLALLAREAEGLEALYLLGDIFEYWIGDDGVQPWQLQLAKVLRQLHDQGCRLYFQHGNRDFLLGEAYAEHCGMQLLAEEQRIDLYGTAVLLMHGDSLCTQDQAYMAFRQQVRQPAWIQQVLSLPLQERIKLAEQMRAQSKMAASNKADDIMDVTPAEVEAALARHQVNILIHGHTHRPQRHPLAEGKERIVLGDWDKQGWLLRVADANPAHWQLEAFAL